MQLEYLNAAAVKLVPSLSRTAECDGRDDGDDGFGRRRTSAVSPSAVLRFGSAIEDRHSADTGERQQEASLSCPGSWQCSLMVRLRASSKLDILGCAWESWPS
jgi:hypothetical protein